MLVLSAQMALGRFGYGTGPFDGKMDDKTRRALQEYQRYNTLPVTGAIDCETFIVLTDNIESLERQLVFLPPYIFFGDTQFVMAQGTWTLVNDEQAWPLQTTTIHCHRKWNHCIESTAIVADGERLSLELNYYEVERWDNLEIVTKPRGLACVRYTLRLSLSQRTVTGLRMTKPAAEGCEFIGKQDIQLRLDNGTEIWRELDTAHSKAIGRVMRLGDFKFENERDQ